MTKRKIKRQVTAVTAPTFMEALHLDDRDIYPDACVIPGTLVEHMRPFSVSYGPSDNLEAIVAVPENDARERVFMKIPYEDLKKIVGCFDFEVKYSNRGNPSLRNPRLARDIMPKEEPDDKEDQRI